MNGFNSSDYECEYSSGWTSEEAVILKDPPVARRKNGVKNRVLGRGALRGIQHRTHGNGVLVLDLKNTDETKTELRYLRDHLAEVSTIVATNADISRMSSFLLVTLQVLNEGDTGKQKVKLSMIIFHLCAKEIGKLKDKATKKGLLKRMEDVLEKIDSLRRGKNPKAVIKGDRNFNKCFKGPVSLAKSKVAHHGGALLRLNGGGTAAEQQVEDYVQLEISQREERKDAKRRLHPATKALRMLLCASGTSRDPCHSSN